MRSATPDQREVEISQLRNRVAYLEALLRQHHINPNLSETGNPGGASGAASLESQ